MGMKKRTDYIFNPLLYFGIGLLPALLVCDNLKAAVIFSALIVAEIIIINLIISGFKTIIVHYVRIPIYAIMILCVIYFLDSVTSVAFPKIYGESWSLVQVLFVSVVTFFICEYTSNELSLKSSLGTSLRVVMSYALVLILVGALVEILGYGKIWDVSILQFNGLEFFRSKAGCILILTVFAFVYNIIANYLLQKRIVYQSLVNRYTVYLTNYYDDVLNKGGQQ